MYVNDESNSENTYFNSDLSVKHYGAPTSHWVPIQFHFHHPAEHPVNGFNSPIEMHVIHNAEEFEPDSKIKGSVIVVLFSAHDFDRTISQDDNRILQKFFELMRLDQRVLDDDIDKSLGVLNFKAAMNVFNFEDRWAYLGCTTLPPCKKYTIWHILRSVYPIETRQYILLERKFEENIAVLGSSENNRAIYPINGQDIIYIGAIYLSRIAALSISVAVLAFAF